jgi:hypothetical protein
VPGKEKPLTDVPSLAIDLSKRRLQVRATAAGGACVDAAMLQGDYATIVTGWRFYRARIRPLDVA